MTRPETAEMAGSCFWSVVNFNFPVINTTEAMSLPRISVLRSNDLEEFFPNSALKAESLPKNNPLSETLTYLSCYAFLSTGILEGFPKRTLSFKRKAVEKWTFCAAGFCV